MKRTMLAFILSGKTDQIVMRIGIIRRLK